MKVVKVLSTRIKDSFLYTKLLKSGKSDVQEVKTASLPGIDSVPLEDDRALYEVTDLSGENFVIGFLVKNRSAEPGEVRFFSLNDQAQEQIFLHLKKTGEIHFGGDSKNLTRYQELETAFNELKEKHNDLVTAFNAHMHPTAGTGLPSPPTPGPGIPATPSTADITGAKIDKLKTL